jgi:hypothetical protein
VKKFALLVLYNYNKNTDSERRTYQMPAGRNAKMCQFYLPDHNQKEVEQLAQRLGVARSAAVRLAVSRLLAQMRKSEQAEPESEQPQRNAA